MNENPSTVSSERGKANSISTSVKLERQGSRPLEHFRFCKSLLAEARKGGSSSIEQKYSLALRHPAAENFPPSMAALALIARFLGKQPTCLLAKKNDDLLPLPVMADLVKIWEELGDFIEPVKKAKEWLQRIGPPAAKLFYTEKDFNVREVEEYLSKGSDHSFGMDLDLGIASLTTEKLNGSMTLSGWNIGVGTWQFGDVSIAAMGPQSFPLSETALFGIAQKNAQLPSIQVAKDSLSFQGWTRFFGAKEIWLEISANAKAEKAAFDVRWVGISPTQRQSFSFYVQAKTCQLADGSIYYPQKINRFLGKSQKIILDQKILLECSEILNMQVIPLAGAGCFWDASFLIAFEFTSSQNRASYSFSFL